MTYPGYPNPQPPYQNFDQHLQVSEAGRKVYFPGGPLPIVEPIPMAFKRFFTEKWHVYAGLTLLPLIPLSIFFISFMIPLIIESSKTPDGSMSDPIEDISLAFLLIGALAYFATFIVMIISNVALFTVAMRDFDGEAPSWGRAFKGLRWGSAIGVMILLYIAILAIAIACGALSYGLMQVEEFLVIPVILLFMVVMFLAFPYFAMVPFYAIEGKTGPFGAFKQAWTDVKANYWQVFGALILLAIVNVGIYFVSMGLAVIVITPVSVLGHVFIYKWISSTPEVPPGATPGYPSASGYAAYNQQDFYGQPNYGQPGSGVGYGTGYYGQGYVDPSQQGYPGQPGQQGWNDQPRQDPPHPEGYTPYP